MRLNPILKMGFVFGNEKARLVDGQKILMRPETVVKNFFGKILKITAMYFS